MHQSIVQMINEAIPGYIYIIQIGNKIHVHSVTSLQESMLTVPSERHLAAPTKVSFSPNLGCLMLRHQSEYEHCEFHSSSAPQALPVFPDAGRISPELSQNMYKPTEYKRSTTQCKVYKHVQKKSQINCSKIYN